MQKCGEENLYLATELVGFLMCEHLTTFGRLNLQTPFPKIADSEQAKLIPAKGYPHEAGFVAIFKARHSSLIDISVTQQSVKREINARSPKR